MYRITTVSNSNKQVELQEFDKREVVDQLLKLLGENQVFLNKIQMAQWNFDVFGQEEYSAIINLLFNCAEKIAVELKLHNGFVPAYLEVYLGVSSISEQLELHSETDVVQDILLSHRSLLNYLISFFNDSMNYEDPSKGLLINYLYTAHSNIFQILQEWESD